MTTRQWHYVQGGRQAGPVAEDVLRRMVDTGTVRANDLVWTDGFAEWRPVGQIPEFSSRSAGVAAPAFEPENVSPYAAPMVTETRSYGAASAGRVTYAGFWKRFVAAIIDGIIMRVVGYAGGLAIGLAFAGISQEIAVVLAGIFGLLLNWFYFAFMESSDSQGTLGKMALGIKVTDLAGHRIGFGQATGRHFAKIVSALILMVGFIMAGFTEKKQALHDMMAGCLVVNKR